MVRTGRLANLLAETVLEGFLGLELLIDMRHRCKNKLIFPGCYLQTSIAASVQNSKADITVRQF